jgi:Domain of unknown function (DUF4258)
VPHRLIDRIRRKILLRDYDLTIHAIEEMAEDDFDILDIEHAVLTGQVVRRHKHDPRGIKYTIQGLSADGEKLVGIVDRFHGTDRFLIITVYDIKKYH